MKTAVGKTLGILYTEQSAMPLSEEKIPLHVGIYFYCYAEEDEIGGTPCKDEVIVIRQSFWQENGAFGDDTTMKMSLFSAKMQMGMDSYEEIKTYFLEHFSHKMAFYKLMRFFIRNDIDFGCYDEELVEELEEDTRVCFDLELQKGMDEEDLADLN